MEDPANRQQTEKTQRPLVLLLPEEARAAMRVQTDRPEEVVVVAAEDLTDLRLHNLAQEPPEHLAKETPEAMALEVPEHVRAAVAALLRLGYLAAFFLVAALCQTEIPLVLAAQALPIPSPELPLSTPPEDMVVKAALLHLCQPEAFPRQ